MEILYSWIQKYNNIEKQGFNFSPNWYFNYDDETKTLQIEDKRDSTISNFFGENITNVTAIIGENGSGKSSVLDFRAFNILIFVTNHEYFIYTDKEVQIPTKYNCFTIEPLQNGYLIEDEKFNETFKLRYSNILNFDFEEEYISENSSLPISWHQNLNVGHLLTNNWFNVPGKNYSKSKNLNKWQIINQLQFLFDFRKILIPFNTPDTFNVHIELVREFEIFNKIYDESLPHNESDKYRYTPTYYDKLKITIDTIKSNFEKELTSLHLSYSNNPTISLKRKIFLVHFEWAIFFCSINMHGPGGDGSFFELLFNSSLQWKDKGIDKWIVAFFEKEMPKYHNTSGIKYFEYLKIWAEKAPTLIANLRKLLSNIKPESISYEPSNSPVFSNSFGPIGSYPKECFLEIEIRNHKYSNLVNNVFLQGYKNILWSGKIFSPGFLKFSWRGMSSGESAFLSLFSRIHFCNHRIAEIKKREIFEREEGVDIKHMLLLIDEGETGFHPKWQKEYIKFLTDLLPYVFPNKRIQIILTSNSPFVVSDLPAENIIFLRKNEDGKCIVEKDVINMKNTFGSNIHTLLANTFFMDGLISEFAKQKIEQVNKYINGKIDMDEKEAKRVIDLVGEPIIQKYLLKEYEKNRDKNILKEKDKEIERLKEENKKLRNDKNKERKIK